MKTVNVQFTRTYTVNAVNGATYLEGSVHRMTESQARHFTRRGVAVEVKDVPEVTEKKVPFGKPSRRRTRS